MNDRPKNVDVPTSLEELSKVKRAGKVKRVKGILLILLSMLYMSLIVLAYEALRAAFNQSFFYFESYQAMAVFIIVTGLIVTYLVRRAQERRETIEAENEQLISALQQSLEEVNILSGMLPICSHCKKIRNDEGYWQQIETYIAERSEAIFSHGICEDCLEKHYPIVDRAKGRDVGQD